MFSLDKEKRFIAIDFVFLTMIGMALWLWTCGLRDLWGEDESRYVQIAKELLTRHNRFLLTVQTPNNQATFKRVKGVGFVVIFLCLVRRLPA